MSALGGAERMRKLGITLLLSTAIYLGACNEPSPTQDVAPAATEMPSDVTWPAIGGDASEQHFSPLDQINPQSIADLGLAWSLDLDTYRGQEATPIVIDGVIYTTTAWSKVIAADAVTGKQIWSFDPQVPGETAYLACCDVVNRGAAYADGKVISATLDGRLIALDAESGNPVWSVNTLDAEDWPYTITGAPRIAKDLVIIGNGGADYGVRGYVSAYKIETGELAWRFFTVPGNPANGPDNAASDDILASVAEQTWAGEFWQYGGGGTVWDAIVYDEELDQLYLGVGNGSPWNHRIRSQGVGDNLFLSSIVALDPDTGGYLWHYQETPAESWDFTATQPIILADLSLDGETRKVLMQAPKNGFFYVIDRVTGDLISAENFVPTSWATGIDMDTGRPIETENARYLTPEVMLPGGPGAHNWQPMAYSPDTGLVYIPAQSIPFFYVEDGTFRYQRGKWNPGVDLTAAPPPSTAEDVAVVRDSLMGSLIAWDPATQTMRWKVDHERPVNGGILATGGGLVFQGSASGTFKAFDASTGEEVWSFDAQDGIVAAPMSYAIDGEQYVAVMVGYGGAMALALPDPYQTRAREPGRLLAFKLGASEALPPAMPAPDFVIPDDIWSDELIAQGSHLFAVHCSGCHSVGTISANVVPDLRRSNILTSSETWQAVVTDGILSDRGMVSFADTLTPDEVESIRAYVADRARVASEWTASDGVDDGE